MESFNSEVTEELLEAVAKEVDSGSVIEALLELIEKFHLVHRKLEDQERIYRSTISTMAEGVLVQDGAGNIIMSNKKTEEILGPRFYELFAGTSADSGWRPVHEDGVPFAPSEHPAAVTLRSGEAHRGVIGVHRPDGKFVWISINSEPIRDSAEEGLKMVVTTFSDITDRKIWEEELKRISVTDYLTQLYNRVKLNDELKREIARVSRYQAALSLVMFDIDHFKRINDTYGHDVGDSVLVGVVRIVNEMIRDTDLFARWGGEEFIILLPSTTEEDAYSLAERVRGKIEASAFGEAGSITCSFGVAEYMPSESQDEVIKRVDTALYEAKRSGRNRVVVR